MSSAPRCILHRPRLRDNRFRVAGFRFGSVESRIVERHRDVLGAVGALEFRSAERSLHQVGSVHGRTRMGRRTASDVCWPVSRAAEFVRRTEETMVTRGVAVGAVYVVQLLVNSSPKMMSLCCASLPTGKAGSWWPQACTSSGILANHGEYGSPTPAGPLPSDSRAAKHLELHSDMHDPACRARPRWTNISTAVSSGWKRLFQA